MKSSSLSNISTADLRAELDQIVDDTAEWMERAAAILVELRARKESHPLMHSNVLRFFKGIAGGSLSSKAVLAVGGNRNLVRALHGLPLGEQDAIATERPVQVVEISPEGKHVIVDRTITTLSQSALDRVFGEKGLRSIEEQKQMLGQETHKERISGFLVDRKASVIVFGNKRVTPFDLIAPLKALGYRIEKIKGGE